MIFKDTFRNKDRRDGKKFFWSCFAYEIAGVATKVNMWFTNTLKQIRGT